MNRARSWCIGLFVMLGLAVVVAPPLDWFDGTTERQVDGRERSGEEPSTEIVVTSIDEAPKDDCLRAVGPGEGQDTSTHLVERLCGETRLEWTEGRPRDPEDPRLVPTSSPTP